LPRTAQTDTAHILAVVGAWLLPGLGHWLIGERQRALILAVAIGGLWFSGLLIGSIGIIHRAEHPWWFAGQMLMAPSLVVEQVRHHVVPTMRSPDDPATFALEPPFGRTAEQAILYTALAGLLNLLAIIDVLHRPVARHAPLAGFQGGAP